MKSDLEKRRNRAQLIEGGGDLARHVSDRLSVSKIRALYTSASPASCQNRISKTSSYVQVRPAFRTHFDINETDVCHMPVLLQGG